MNISPENEIFEHITVRQYLPEDKDRITEIVKSQPKMFGGDITSFHNGFISALTNPVPNSAVFVGLVDNVIEQTFIMRFWDALPLWNAGCNFASKQKGLDFVKQRALGMYMWDNALSYAEERGVNSGYICIAESGGNLTKRLQTHGELYPNVSKRYYASNVDIIAPFSTSRYEVFNTLMGPLLGKNKHPVAVRFLTKKIN